MGLSAGDIDAISKSWSTVYASKDKNGDEFLMQLFTKFPNNANFFSDFKGKSAADIKASPKLRDVSTRIMGRLDEFVKCAGDAGKLDGLLQAFAKQHLTYGVKSQQYEDVKQMFGGYLSSVGADASSVGAWEKFFSLIVDAFKKNES